MLVNIDGFATGQLLYGDGKIVTLNFVKDGTRPFALTAVGENGYLHRQIVRDEHPHLTGVKMFTEMYETRIEPTPHEEILAPIRILEALERSRSSGEIETVG